MPRMSRSRAPARPDWSRAACGLRRRALSAHPMTAEPEASTGGRSSAALYTLLSVMFINMMGFGVIVPFLPSTPLRFTPRPGRSAWSSRPIPPAPFIGGALLGQASDRLGRKPILIWTVAANCLCYGALAFAPTSGSPSSSGSWAGMAAGNGSVVQGVHRRRDAGGAARRPYGQARRGL